MSGYTGELAEQEMFGSIEVVVTPENRAEVFTAREYGSSYMKYKEAMDSVRRLAAVDRSYDPTAPKATFAYDLRAAVAEGLDLKDKDVLRFYTAVLSRGKTYLDVCHGVDAFLELERDGQRSVVTMNGTLSLKHQVGKTNILITMPDGVLDPDLPEDEDKYWEKVKAAAQVAIDIFEKQSYYTRAEV